jgi:crotonobetainyl-CoA:carnitine CoA-transferase CaiB-like acyl-CoA transferase
MLLNGMRVISFCHYLHGPAATQYLADLGAEVIKIEPPGGPLERRWSGGNSFVDGISSFFLSANRNKRSLAIDLKHPDSRDIIQRIIRRSHVLVENFRPGVLERLGYGLEAVRAIRPDIIYASASGYSSSGPLKDAPGQDMLAQARSGMIAAADDYGMRPVPAGNAIVDQHGGTLIALGVVAAYVKQLQTREGTRIEANLLNAALDLQTEPLTSFMSDPANTRAVFKRDSHLATWYHPAPYGIYRMSDCFIAISMNNTAGPLAELLDSDVLRELSVKDLLKERDTFAAELARLLMERRLEDMAPGFSKAGIWFARVQDYDDLRSDPQVAANQVFREVPVGRSKATLVNHPLRYDGKVPELRHLATRCGQDGRSILAEIGYSDDRIRELSANGAIYEQPEQ